ncbi:MAG: hypothetical protein O7C75_21265, partial [Verrucomicrobia bacterium]|nr:hypothetical protein [Verrucomicrobiota bacterium]
IYLPIGTYDLWPEDKAVEIVNGLPTVRVGKSYTSSLFTVTSDNIKFLGDEDPQGNPTTFLNLYLWNKVPSTQWLEIVNRDGSVKNVRRYFMFVLQSVQNFTLKNLDINGGAVPVNTGKKWYSLDDKRYQWDINHKMVAAWSPRQAKNVLIDNVNTKNWRGEVYYNGGANGEKWLLKDGKILRTNSSSVSGSFDLELVNMVIAESANASLESAIYSENESTFNRRVYNQNHIARGCSFIGLDQSGKGVMKNLPGEKNFGGWYCFNQEGTYQTVTDCDFRDTIAAAFAPWYEYRNGFLYNSTFGQVSGKSSGSIFYLNTNAKKDYQLAGGMTEILWFDNELHLKSSLPSHQTVFTSYPGKAAMGNESPWIWEGFHIRNLSDNKIRVNRFWVDTWNLESGRDQAVFKNFTKDETITFDKNYLYNTKPGKIHPVYQNFFR